MSIRVLSATWPENYKNAYIFRCTSGIDFKLGLARKKMINCCHIEFDHLI